MTDYNEVVTVPILTDGKERFPNGCAHCGKPVGIPVVPLDSPSDFVPQAYIQTSADNFCSVECRRAFHLARGCQRCRDRKPTGLSDPGWRFGAFGSYMETEVTCPQCVVEWPKYEAYVAGIEAANTEIRRLASEEFASCPQLPGWLDVSEYNGNLVFTFCDGGWFEEEDFRVTLAWLNTHDFRDHLRRVAECESRISAIVARITAPKPYQRWLAGER